MTARNGNGAVASTRTLALLAQERVAAGRVAELEAELAAAVAHVQALLPLVPMTAFATAPEQHARNAAQAWLEEAKGRRRS